MPSNEPTHVDDLLPSVYKELRRLARRQRRRHVQPNRVLTTTALVHEAYIKLSRKEEYSGQEHLLAVAATAMRHLLVDEVRRDLSQKRGDGQQPISLTGVQELVAELEPEDTHLVLAVDQTLAKLGEEDERLRQVVDCRFFAGLTVKETAEAIGVHERTVRRDWERAREHLRRGLAEAGAAGPSNGD